MTNQKSKAGWRLTFFLRSFLILSSKWFQKPLDCTKQIQQQVLKQQQAKELKKIDVYNYKIVVG